MQQITSVSPTRFVVGKKENDGNCKAYWVTHKCKNLQLVPAIFYQIFISHQIIALHKL